MIQQASGYLEPKELIMSDIPWATAWYGDRDSVWATLFAYEARGGEDLAAIHQRRKKLSGLYLTQVSTVASFVDDMFRPARFHERHEEVRREAVGVVEDLNAAESRVGWPEFVYRSMKESWLPVWFPLTAASSDFIGLGQFLVLDVARWNGAQTKQELYTKPPGEMRGRVVDEGLDNP
jgi:hypothetical protein